MNDLNGNVDANLELIAHARIRANELSQRLAATPINRGVYSDLQEYLDTQGFAACRAQERLAGRDPRELRGALEELLPRLADQR